MFGCHQLIYNTVHLMDWNKPGTVLKTQIKEIWTSKKNTLIFTRIIGVFHRSFCHLTLKCTPPGGVDPGTVPPARFCHLKRRQSIHSPACEGTRQRHPGGDVTRYWLFACWASPANINRWTSHLFTPLSATDRDSHGTEPGGRHYLAFLKQNLLINCIKCATES